MPCRDVTDVRRRYVAPEALSCVTRPRRALGARSTGGECFLFCGVMVLQTITYFLRFMFSVERGRLLRLVLLRERKRPDMM